MGHTQSQWLNEELIPWLWTCIKMILTRLIDFVMLSAPLLVLLDRDGVINVDRGTWVQDEKDFVLVEGAAEAIASLNRAGHVVAVVTNQSCVGRGLLSAADLDKIHSTMISHLAKSGAHLDQIYVATNTPEDSSSTRYGPTLPRKRFTAGRLCYQQQKGLGHQH